MFILLKTKYFAGVLHSLYLRSTLYDSGHARLPICAVSWHTHSARSLCFHTGHGTLSAGGGIQKSPTFLDAKTKRIQFVGLVSHEYLVLCARPLPTLKCNNILFFAVRQDLFFDWIPTSQIHPTI